MRVRAVNAGLVVGGLSFLLYWATASVLAAQGTTGHFGADAHLYQGIAFGNVFDRTTRFHPVTVAMAVAWMKVVSPLQSWLALPQLLNALFALVGAAGAGAATAVFAALMPRRLAIACGCICASTLACWYFSAIPESKIVTAALSNFYLLAYVHMRHQPTAKGVAILSAVLALACLNEIVSLLLVAIPIVDTVWRKGVRWSHGRWIVAHAMVVPLCLLVLEVLVNGRLVAPTPDTESQSHLSMLVYYVLKNDHSLDSLYAFAVNWLVFNFAAPTPTAPMWPQAGGYFEPSVAPFLGSVPAVTLVALLGLILLLPRLAANRAPLSADTASLLVAGGCYALARAAFFFVFNPAEPLLFSPAVTLPHAMMILVPSAVSHFERRLMGLAMLCGLLLWVNLGFMLG